MTLIVHGPQGCGKTRYAMALANQFACTHIVEDWNGSDPLRSSALALTNLAPADFDAGDSVVMSLARACEIAGIRLCCACGNDGCDGKTYRPVYGREFLPCPLRASVQSSANTASTAV